jgi:hypothetical protein
MGLRDKLLILSQGAEGATAEELVSEWKYAVDSLFAELKLYVSEYTSENLLSLTDEPLTLSE